MDGGAGVGSVSGISAATLRPYSDARAYLVALVSWFLATSKVLRSHCAPDEEDAGGGGGGGGGRCSAILLLPAYILAYAMWVTCALFALFRDDRERVGSEMERHVFEFVSAREGGGFHRLLKAALLATGINSVTGVAAAWTARGRSADAVQTIFLRYSFVALTVTLGCAGITL
jgi:hypothetical protein